MARKTNKIVEQPTAVPLHTKIICCGDNIDRLKTLPAGFADFIDIDPPFNSNRNYEVFWGETKEKRAFDDRHASTAAYVDTMRPRCVELSRVLKPTGSFYYHCDWHASHYVKVMLDQIFGENNLQNEIVWKRSTSPHNDPRRYGANHDSVSFYTAGKRWTGNPQYLKLGEEYVEGTFRHREPDGRRYRLQELTAAKPGGDVSYEWKGVCPPAGRYWAYSQANMRKFEEAGLIHVSKTGFPRYKQYLDESKGVPLQTFWDDIPNASGAERLGYPTQKPLMPLDRLIRSSTNPGDVVLDAFCGCGTALVAAENLGRPWVGIDISPTACRVMAKRLKDLCRLDEDEKLWRVDRGFVVRDLPWSEDRLRKLPHFEFENWARIALGGIPNKAQAGDMGIDGRIYPVTSTPRSAGPKVAELPFMDVCCPSQVKQKDKVGRPDIDAFFRRSGQVIIALTVRKILDEQFAKRLA